MAPRVALDQLARRPEAKRTGIYVLVGDDEKHPGRRRIYVGEGDEVLARIRKHDAERDFWEHVMIFVSKDENLTKAHVRFLEARLISVATEARRATIDNATKPEGGSLPEADLAEMEEFLQHIRMLASTLGVDVFEAATTVQERPSQTASALELGLAGKGYQARAVVVDGRFVVAKGSIARIEEAPSLSASSRAMRVELTETDVLVQDERKGLIFAQDFAFDSASGAAQVISGANVNGRTAWKLGDGRTLKEWEESNVEGPETRVDS